MKIYLNIILLIGLFQLIQAQQIFEVYDFSDKFFAKINIQRGYEGEVFKKGKVQIFDFARRQLVLEIVADELVLDNNPTGKIRNHQIPYDKQSIIIAEDFNLDGEIDLAVMDGHNSCYHLPSYQIYLQKNNQLIHNAAFTRLAQEYCGMFHIDPIQKEISTMTKSGCCFHEYYSFRIQQDLPELKEIYTESVAENGLTLDISHRIFDNNKAIENNFQKLSHQNLEEKIVYSFAYNNGKRMWLLRQGNHLNYLFVNENEKVELLYQGLFYFHQKIQMLSFTFKDTTYSILSNGIEILQNDKKIFMQCADNSFYGNWEDIILNDYTNVLHK